MTGHHEVGGRSRSSVAGRGDRGQRPVPASLSVVIPFYNEEPNVEAVIAEIGDALRDASISYELICVDSASTDATPRILSRLAADAGHIRIVSVERKGYGLAVLRGLQAASKDWITVVSGDGQTDPIDILKAYAVMAITGADLVKPRRFSRDDGLLRRFISFACSVIMKLVFRLPGWDFMGPPKVIRRSLVDQMCLESEDRFIDTELLLKAKELGVRMEEVGVTYRRRAGGVGKVGVSTIFEYLVNIVKWRLSYRRLVTDKVRRSVPASRSLRAAGAPDGRR